MSNPHRSLHRLGRVAAVSALVAVSVPAGTALLDTSADDPGRIVNGDEIPITEAPWQVAIVEYFDIPGGGARWGRFCGGSIYDANGSGTTEWIITAAHCFDDEMIVDVNNFDEDYIRIVAGRADIFNLEPGDFTIVEQILVHPGFEDVTGGNDVALLKLDTPLTLNDRTIKSINLPTQPGASWPAEGDEGWTTGWGRLRDSGPRPSNLHGIDLQVLGGPSDPVCGDYGTDDYPTATFDRVSMICAGPLDDAGPGGTCKGDSGGPFAIEDNDVWYLAGITSWGIGCGNRIYNDGLYPLEPTRVLSTRVSDGGTGPVEPGVEIDIDVADQVDINAASVMVNITATGALGDGFITAYTCGDDVPGTSNLNYVGVTTIANTAIVDLDDEMSICLRTGDAATDILVDLVGYFADSGGYLGLDPQRIVNTRASDGGDGPIAADDELAFALDLGVEATAVVLNVTAVNSLADGYLTVFACDQDLPDTSNLNYVGVTTIANTAIVELSRDEDGEDSICIYVGDGATDILVDLYGVIEPSASYLVEAPERFLSTRVSDGGDGPVAAGKQIEVVIFDEDKIPDVASAVAVNITATNAQGDGYLTAYACGEDPPGTSNLNYVGITTVAANALVEVGEDGKICIEVGDAATDILVDAIGLFAPTQTVIEGDFPSVYTRVTTYRQWILDNT